MRKRKATLRTPQIARRHNAQLAEVSADDVIGQLLDLFDHIGIDASRLTEKTSRLRFKAIASRRLYPHVAAIGELLAQWHQDPEFLEESGKPRALKIRGRGLSFHFLAKKSVPKMDPDRLLAELARIGALAIDEKKVVTVLMRSLPVYEDRRLAIQHTLTSLDSFIKTLRHNLISAPSNSEQLFHRVARSKALDIDQLQALKIRVKRQGQTFLESNDNWMAKRLKVQDRKARLAQVAIGVYLSIDRV